ncbi:MAG: hypothetical protein ABEJ99_01615 [Candidatus Nanohaloarchaea archaeon]
MNAQKTTLTVLSVAVVAGVALSAFSFNIQVPRLDNHDSGLASKKRFIYGSDHDHALFHVVLNGTQKDFSSEKFQLNSRYVHLENNDSEIVHKHAKGVTWSYFFQTINTSLRFQDNSTLCIDIMGNTTCGDGQVVLNGKNVTSLDREIQQGDNLLVIIGTEDMKKMIEMYMQQELPKEYQSLKKRAYRV